MRRTDFVAVIFLAVSTLCSASSPYIVPTTTLTALTSNNTSTANSFPSQSNGNRGAGSTSTIDVHSLLYSGATTKIYAHLLLWFGDSSHMNVGYSSTDAAQIKHQINDMVSRGIDGVIIDWYGPNNSIDQGTKLVMAEAENHPGFTFAIMIDKGAINRSGCSGCSPQQAIETELQYMEHTYFSSPAYMTRQGQPVVTNFAVDQYYSIDWNAANASLSTHPVFLFQNSDGFTHTISDGSYAWVMPTTSDYGIGYLSSFYKTGMSFPQQQVVGATYKGFNDNLASWGSNRVMQQQCGQTWLQTFTEINNLYNSGKQLSDLQLVTWNDYEEATELESGIDNCLTLSPLVAGDNLQWNISGNENTVDHYTVYISSDGQNLMPLTDLEPGLRSLNLCGFSIPKGSYKLFVQAVGKPILANQISGAVNYNSTCATAPAPVPPPPPAPAPTPTPAPTLSFGASPTSISVSAGQPGRFTITATPQSGAFNSPIVLSCAGIPSSLNCSFSPATMTPGSGVATSTVTISTVAARKLPRRHNPLPIHAGLLLPFGIGGLALVGSMPRRRKAQLLAVIAVVSIGMAGSSCGGNFAKPQTLATVGPAASRYSVTIQGNAASSKLSTVVEVTVQ
jgi:hypothetical protein